MQRGRDRTLGYTKLALGLLGILLLARYAYELHGLGPALGVCGAFVVLAVLHERVLRRLHNLDLVIGFYKRGLERLEDRWAGTGETGESYIQDSHPYSRDLGIFGRGSLFELLCTFRTRAGEETLARWLLEAAPPGEVEIRQHAVQELRERGEFRESLFTAGDQVRLGLHPGRLVAWAARDSPLQSRIVPIALPALAMLWAASAVFWFVEGRYWPFFLISAINAVFNSKLKKRFQGAIQSAESATADLELLCKALRVIEKEDFGSARLRQMQAELKKDGVVASAAVAKLSRIAQGVGQRRNLMVKAIDRFVFYTVLYALRAEAWRREYGPRIGVWLEAVGEMEALTALSCYAFEHPEDAWPEFNEGEGSFEAEGLAHPLLPAGKGVRNDVTLGGGLRLMVLSGPNMSGKSTFVRAIGINTVLAQSGAPVRARRLRMSPLAVGASICVFDSLQGGVSRFYAEIQRLKLIYDMMDGPVPVLFLLDELLSGTNSHDRLQGSELLVRSFVQRGAIGLITTHDLALTRIPESLHGQAQNYHFEDCLEDGKLRFDFKLKEGVVQTSNALRLMEAIGLFERDAAGSGDSVES